MTVSKKEVTLTVQQQRVVKPLSQFRFVSAPLLAQAMAIRRVSAATFFAYNKV